MMNRGKRIAPALAISLLSALLAYSALMPAALAQNPDDIVCPLSDEQAQKSIQAFDKIAKVFTGEPRCVNCHGAVNPFGADADKTHGGFRYFPVMKTQENPDTGKPETIEDTGATFQQCTQCHGAFLGRWVIPPPGLLFAGKDAFTLCKLEKDQFSEAKDFVDHLEHDIDPSNPFVEEAFTGRMGLTGGGLYLAAKYPAPPGVTHQELNQMAHDWVDAQGGKFVGGLECGCKKRHYAIGVKETGVFDHDLADGGRLHGDISGQGDVPLTFKDDGSFEGKATIPVSLAESLTRPIQVCNGKGSISNQMKVKGNIDEAQGGAMHVKFSFIWDEAVSGTYTGKGVTIPFNKKFSV